jgi:YegS/Rv2252/BmrU family lipid kinase
MSKTLCLLNGSKKKSSVILELIAQCQTKWSSDFQVIESRFEKDLVDIARKHASKADVIIAIGGDGTLNEIINGLISSGQEELPAIAIVPIGTGNDFFQSAGLKSFKIQTFMNALLAKNTLHCDIGKIQTDEEIRYFMNVADIGFGGDVVLSLNQFRKQFGAGFSYGLAILKTFLAYKRPHVRIESESFQYNGELLLAAACNGAIFGNGLHIHPGASIRDGKLNMTVLGKVSMLDYLLNVMKVKRGKRIKHPEAHYFESNQLVLKTKGLKLHAETDGEYLSGTRFEISILPQRIKILLY